MMKYVEAMIDYSAPEIGDVEHSTELDVPKKLNEKIQSAIEEFAKLPGVTIVDADPLIDALSEKITEIIEASLDDFGVEVTCSAENTSGVPLIQVGTPEGIARQLYNALFLSGDEVAIVKLDDLKALQQEHRDRLDEISKCEKCHAFMVIEGALCESCIQPEAKSA